LLLDTTFMLGFVVLRASQCFIIECCGIFAVGNVAQLFLMAISHVISLRNCLFNNYPLPFLKAKCRLCL